MSTTRVADGFGALLRVARRTLAADAVAVLLGDRLVDHHGLTADERATLTRDPGAYAREFARVVGSSIVLERERLGAIVALQRTDVPLEHEDLLGVFATHVAIAVGLRERDPDDALLSLPTDLDRLVLSVHDLKELSAAVDAVVGPLFGGAQAGVMVADTQRNVLQLAPGGFGNIDDAVTASVRDSIYDPRSNSARVFASGHPYVSNLAKRDPGIRTAYAHALRCDNVISLPLPRIGVLHICNKPDPFTIDDVHRALALAPRVASMVELAITLLGLRRQQQLEEVLADVAVQVASGAALDAFAGPALESVCAATDAGMLAIVADDAEPLLVRRGRRRADLEASVLDAAGDDPGVRAYVLGPRALGDEGWAAYWVPVRLGAHRLGTLAALRCRGEPFAEPERRALGRLADLVALARAAERYQQQRDDLARLRERQRIAEDLHDDVAQILFAAQISIDASLRHDELDDSARDAMTRARALLVRGDGAIRSVIDRLASPPAADLATRLRAAGVQVADEFGAPISVAIAPAVDALSLDREVGDALVRVAREALVNAAKHAQANRILLSARVTRTGRVAVTVDDDGCGLGDADGTGRHGLRSMRRAMRRHGGTLRVHHSERGTRISASVPPAG